MLDSAGKRVAEQGQLQFLAERRERLPSVIQDVLLYCWQHKYGVGWCAADSVYYGEDRETIDKLQLLALTCGLDKKSFW